MAARSLVRARDVSVVSILCLALGFGLSTVLYAALDGLLLRGPAGVSQPDQIFRVYLARRNGLTRVTRGGGLSYADYTTLRNASVFDGLAASAPIDLDLSRGADAARVHGAYVSGGYFTLLGIHPAAGRLFASVDEGDADSEQAVVLANDFAVRRYGTAAAAVGSSLVLNGRSFAIIGVAAADFAGLERTRIDAWIPITAARELEPGGNWLTNPNSSWLQLDGRLRTGASITATERIATQALRSAARVHPAGLGDPSISLVSVNALWDPGRPVGAQLPFWLALASWFVLLIAVTNVAQLLVTRLARQQQAIAIRLALGSRRVGVLRQLAAEGVLLAGCGGIAGLIVAIVVLQGAKGAAWFTGATLSPIAALRFAMVAIVATAFVLSVAPMLWIAGAALVTNASVGLSLAPRRARWITPLLTAQMAWSLLLLSTAVIFVRSLVNLNAQQTALDIDHLLVVEVDGDGEGYDRAAQDVLYGDLSQRIRALPGVTAVDVAELVPLREVIALAVTVPSAPNIAPPPNGPYVNYIGSGYLQAVGTKLLSGRFFTSGDNAHGQPVAVINAAMAAHYFHGANALDQCLNIGPPSTPPICTRVVGVVETGRYMQLREQPTPAIFLPILQDSARASRALFVRTVDDPAKLSEVVRRAAAATRLTLPYVDVQPMVTLLRSQTAPTRDAALILSTFTGIALVIAAIGLYSVLAFTVSARTREIGVRSALGASRWRVSFTVLAASLRAVTIGIVLGELGAQIVAQFTQAYLFNASPLDFSTALVVACVLAIVAVTACSVPVSRAVRLQPIIALRH